MSSDEDVPCEQYKVVILGDGAVGKTSISQRFCNDFFAAQYKQTIGLDFFTKEIILPGMCVMCVMCVVSVVVGTGEGSTKNTVYLIQVQTPSLSLSRTLFSPSPLLSLSLLSLSLLSPILYLCPLSLLSNPLLHHPLSPRGPPCRHANLGHWRSEYW